MVELAEKPVLDLAVTIAIMVLEGDVLRDLQALAEGGKEKPDLMADFIPALIKSGRV